MKPKMKPRKVIIPKNRSDNYYFRRSVKIWKSKPKKERTFDNIEYEYPTKKIGKKYYQLSTIYAYNVVNPKKGYDDKDAMLIQAKERYELKKEDDYVKNYRIRKRKGRIEVWANYD